MGIYDVFMTPWSGAIKDNRYIGLDLKCNYITINNIAGKTKEHIERLSVLPINIYLKNLSFGGYPRSIYEEIQLKNDIQSYWVCVNV